jgi:hypothetical protein
MDKRILLAAGAVVAAVALFVVLRPDDEKKTSVTQPTVGTTATTEETTTGETATEGTTTEETTTEAAPPATQVRITYANGRIRGGVKRFSVNRGDRVVVTVRSDVEDEVHVHGYDLMRDVAPGEPARVSFRATLVGGFEIELESRHLLLAEFDVEP